jgi:ABC-type transport system involved in cytochrome c biogenesis permease subunit
VFLCDLTPLLLVLQLLFEGLFFEFGVLFVFYSLFLLAALQELLYGLSWAHFALESQFFCGFLGQTLELPLLK